MPQQVAIFVNAPATTVEVKISNPEAPKDKPKAQEPIDPGETLITSGKHKGKRFKDALQDPQYVKWIREHRQTLVKGNLMRLASYFLAAEQ